MSRFEGALSSIERHDRASRGTAGDHRMDLRIHLEDVKEPDAVWVCSLDIDSRLRLLRLLARLSGRTRARAVHILLTRPNSALAGPVWDLFQENPDAADLAQLVRNIGAPHRFGGLVSRPFALAISRGVDHGNVVESLRLWLDHERRSLSEFIDSEGSGLVPGSVFVERLFEQILRLGSTEQLLRESDSSLAYGFRKLLDPPGRAHLARRYLVGVEPELWSGSLLNLFVQTYARDGVETMTRTLGIPYDRVVLLTRRLLEGELSVWPEPSVKNYWLDRRERIRDVVRCRKSLSLLIETGRFVVVVHGPPDPASLVYPNALRGLLRASAHQAAFADPAGLRAQMRIPHIGSWTRALDGALGWRSDSGQ